MESGAEDMYNTKTNISVSGPEDLQEKYIDMMEKVYHITRPILSVGIVGTGFLGVIGNILTLYVYIKMGFSNTIHVSYTALAVSDLCCILASMAWGAALTGTTFHQLGTQTYEHVINKISGITQSAFTGTTALITAWISLERCLCVVFPMEVKRMITSTVTKTALILIFVLGCFPLAFVYCAQRLEWRFDPKSNSTLLFSLNDETFGPSAMKLSLFLYSLIYPMFSWLSVWVCTIILITTLKRKSRFLKPDSTASGSNPGPAFRSQDQRLAQKENRVTKVIVIVAVVFLLCSLFANVNFLTAFALQTRASTGSLLYLYKINVMLTIWVTELNSSLNFVIFIVAVKRFRAVLLDALSSQCCRK